MVFVVALSGVSCGGTPTALDLASLAGNWRLSVSAHPTCGSAAAARTVNVILDGEPSDDGTLVVSGIWDLGAPTLMAHLAHGEFDAAERYVKLTFVHFSGGAMEFVGEIEDNETVRGKFRAPSDPYPPLFEVGACEQNTVGRKQPEVP